MHLYCYCTCWGLAGNHRSNKTWAQNIYQGYIIESITYGMELLKLPLCISASEKTHHYCRSCWSYRNYMVEESRQRIAESTNTRMKARFYFGLPPSLSYDLQLTISAQIPICQKQQSVQACQSPFLKGKLHFFRNVADLSKIPSQDKQIDTFLCAFSRSLDTRPAWEILHVQWKW